MSSLDARLNAILQARKLKGRFRTLKEYNTASNFSLTDFSSNDYLSLTSSDVLRHTYLARLSSTRDILGSTGSRLLSGGTPAHRALENRFADFFGAPSALLFNSGWDANVSFFSTIPQPGDWVVYDELVHASVHSGMRASRVKPDRRVAFKHNDPAALREVLHQIGAEPSTSSSMQRGTVFVALESLYSMDGDLACLPALLDVLDEAVPRERQCVILDEAHSTGVYGRGGRGVGHALGETGPEGRIGVRLMTFGKAVGSSGAVLLASHTIRSFLINFARPLIFSTAIPHSTLISLECAWDLLEGEDGDRRRSCLMSLSQEFHAQLAPLLCRVSPNTLSLPPACREPFAGVRTIQLDLPASPYSPIIGLLTPRPHDLSAFLLDRGYVVRPVVPPTVPPGGERVRICLRADMGQDVIRGLVAALEQWVDSIAVSSRGRVATWPGGKDAASEGVQSLTEITLKARL